MIALWGSRSFLVTKVDSIVSLVDPVNLGAPTKIMKRGASPARSIYMPSPLATHIPFTGSCFGCSGNVGGSVVREYQALRC